MLFGHIFGGFKQKNIHPWTRSLKLPGDLALYALLEEQDRGDVSLIGLAVEAGQPLQQLHLWFFTFLLFLFDLLHFLERY